jgi:hypothetical protein
MDALPFQPAGPPRHLSLAQSPVSAQQVNNPTAGPLMSVRLVNMSASYAHIGYGPTAAVAQANSVSIPDGSTQEQILLLPNSEKTVRLAPGTWFSGIVETGSGALQIAPGSGGV